MGSEDLILDQHPLSETCVNTDPGPVTCHTANHQIAFVTCFVDNQWSAFMDAKGMPGFPKYFTNKTIKTNKLIYLCVFIIWGVNSQVA